MRDREVEDKIDLDERSLRSTDTVGQMRFWCCLLTSLICHCTELVGRMETWLRSQLLLAVLRSVLVELGVRESPSTKVRRTFD